MIAGWYRCSGGRRLRLGYRLVAIVAAVLIPIVPVKALDDAKRRLAPVLAPVERRLLAIAMFEDVLAADAATADGLLVVAADLPLATPAALARVVAAAVRAPVVVVPSLDGDGSNLLAWRDHATFRPAFGAGSAARHLAEPGAVRLDEPDLALDVDTPADLRAAAARVESDSVTGRRLRDLRLAARLA